MDDSTKDKIEGLGHQVKGSVKEAVGHFMNKPEMEAEGTVEKAAGKAQQKVGDVEKVFEK